MSAFSAAAQDEDGDEIKELQRRLNVAQECIRTLLAEQSKLRSLQAENEDFRATCDHLTRENAEQIGEIVALKWQRDELLEALQNIAGYLDDTAACNSDKAVAAIARAAIAKTKGAA